MTVKLLNPAGSVVGTFSSVQGAINAASDGFKLVLGPGLYRESIIVGKGIAILGANSGVGGAGSREAESIIQGATGPAVTILHASGTVVLDGLTVRNVPSEGAMTVGVEIRTVRSVNLKNNVLEARCARTLPSAVGEAVAIAIRVPMPMPASGDLSIEQNVFGGDYSGNVSARSWARCIWSNGAGPRLAITDNIFVSARIAVDLVSYDAAATVIRANTFLAAGTAISVGSCDRGFGDGFVENAFVDVGVDFALCNFERGRAVEYRPALEVGRDRAEEDDDIPTLNLAGGGSDSVSINGSTFLLSEVLGERGATGPCDSASDQVVRHGASGCRDTVLVGAGTVMGTINVTVTVTTEGVAQFQCRSGASEVPAS